MADRSANEAHYLDNDEPHDDKGAAMSWKIHKKLGKSNGKKPVKRSEKRTQKRTAKR